MTFILCRPVYLGNIGSVARLMKNFGFRDLRLVQPPRNFKDAEARMMSVGAFDILKNASVFESLSQATEDTGIVFGTSSGRRRSHIACLLDEAASEAVALSESDRVAFVLGDERNGLNKEELDRCHRIVRIPTSAEFPSMNVAQAACVIAYELTRSSLSAGGMGADDYSWSKDPSVQKTGNAIDDRRRLPTGKEDDQLFRELRLLLDNIEFSRTYNYDLVLNELRSAYQRMVPSAREAHLLRGFLIKLNQKLSKSECD